MNVKTYQAPDMRSAIAMVKADLGDEAYILSTKRVRKRTLGYPLGRPMLEVCAAVDPEGPQSPATAARRTASPVAADRLPPVAPVPEAAPAPGAPAPFFERIVAELAAQEPPTATPRHAQGVSSRPSRHGQQAEVAVAGHAASPRRAREAVAPETGAGAAVATAPAWGDEGEGEVASEARHVVGELERMVSFLTTSGFAWLGLPGSTDSFRAYAELVENGVLPRYARKIVHTACQFGGDEPATGEELDRRIRQALTQHVSVSGPLRTRGGKGPTALALVGPTGVGKTTTLAKLAARFALCKRLRISFVTVDTYRVAAVEQLQVYARILGVPVDVARSRADLESIMAARRDRDLILIDTAGRSPRDERIGELAKILEAPGVEKWLVTAATTKAEDYQLVASAFRCLEPSRLILTKVDETTSPGFFVNSLMASGLPLSYVTTGQNVPDDIEAATLKDICNRLLAGGL
ncbi:MAG: flagellar biosynthesis protein FlhF [Candidatus Schekmanbacteria bacterium]|nr:flagellar biosynthesis protein FlhF [Candidatus Schekmanbacteria bacterium]